MQKRFFLVSILTITGFITFAQQIPVGSCGIVNVYDAAGNRTKRTYFCNNGIDPYPQRPAVQNTNAEATNFSAESTQEFQEVDALYPNPTTGRFSVTFSKPLDNATIQVLNTEGRIIKQIKLKGNKADFDLSANAGGVYYVRIEQDGKVITKKVVKQ
jgi:hypothetical protein